MANSYFSQEAKANVSLVSSIMRDQVWHSMGIWRNMLGFIKKPKNIEVDFPGNAAQPVPTGMPIEVMSDFISQGREDIIIPMKRVLTGAPTGGDSDPDEQLERIKVAYKRCEINAVGHGVNVKSGPMSSQRMKIYKADLMKGGEMLTDWFSRYYVHFMIQLAIFEGKSQNLTAGLESYPGMKSKARMSHPNFYVAGTGKIAHDGESYTSQPGVAAYETAIEAALNGLVAAPETAMSANLISLMKMSAIRERIPATLVKASAGNVDFYPIVMSGAQWVQLRQDPTFREEQKLALPRGWDHPAFTGAAGHYDGCVLYVDDRLFGVQIDANNAVVKDTNGFIRYGYDIDPTTSNIFVAHNTPLKLAVLFGPSFLGFGIGEKLRIAEEEKKFGRKHDVWADTINGCVRSDYFDEDNYDGTTTAQFLENTSSLVCATYSPHNFSWS